MRVNYFDDKGQSDTPQSENQSQILRVSRLLKISLSTIGKCELPHKTKYLLKLCLCGLKYRIDNYFKIMSFHRKITSLQHDKNSCFIVLFHKIPIPSHPSI